MPTRSPSPPFRRRVTLGRPAPGAVEAAVEDHIHHFAVRIEHADGMVTAVEGRAVRAPWTTCPGAIAVLRELVGRPVGVIRVDRPGDHCTHLLDLALVAVRFAASGPSTRRYELTISEWDGDATDAIVERDDGRSLRWTVERGTIVEPEPFAGHSIGAGFTAWVDESLDEDTGELALLLRRAVWMSPSRGFDLDAIASLSDLPIASGACFASQPERIHLARRNSGTALPELGEVGAPETSPSP
jgi:hypothetical protein